MSEQPTTIRVIDREEDLDRMARDFLAAAERFAARSVQPAEMPGWEAGALGAKVALVALANAAVKAKQDQGFVQGSATALGEICGQTSDPAEALCYAAYWLRKGFTAVGPNSALAARPEGRA